MSRQGALYIAKNLQVIMMTEQYKKALSKIKTFNSTAWESLNPEKTLAYDKSTNNLLLIGVIPEDLEYYYDLESGDITVDQTEINRLFSRVATPAIHPSTSRYVCAVYAESRDRILKAAANYYFEPCSMPVDLNDEQVWTAVQKAYWETTKKLDSQRVRLLVFEESNKVQAPMPSGDSCSLS